MRSDGPLLYPNADAVRAAVFDAAPPRTGAGVVVLDLATSTQLDVQSADALDRPRAAAAARGHRAAPRRGAPPGRPRCSKRAGAAEVAAVPTLDAAVHPPEVTSDHPAP